MAHNRIIKSDWDAESGIATIEKTSQYGIVTGIACFNDEDLPKYKNKWIGWRIAEYRADIAIQKKKVNKLKARVEGAKMLFNQATLMSDLDDVTEDYFDIERRVIHNIEKQYLDEREILCSMRYHYNDYCDTLIQQRKEFLDKHEKKNKNQNHFS